MHALTRTYTLANQLDDCSRIEERSSVQSGQVEEMELLDDFCMA